MYDFYSIISDHGFTLDRYDFESTIAGFDHDIHFALLNDRSVFDIDRSRSYRQWDDPNAFVRADLVTRGGDVAAGVRFFQQRWSTELRYENPVREIIDLRQSTTTATIRVLTISQHNAMTLLFNIK